MSGLSRRAAIGGALVTPAALSAISGSARAAGSSDEGYRPYSASAVEPAEVLSLWPKGLMPGTPIPPISETVDDQWDNDGLRYRVAAHVLAPTLSWFPAAEPTGAAILIIPGGGYSRVGIDREGYESARWFAANGIQAFVLRYRLPADRWGSGPLVALQDAQRAMRLIRSGAGGRWKVNPSRVSVLGGSAGGHLALSLCIKVYERTYSPIDELDRLMARPDGALLLYPVVSMGVGAHLGSRAALLGTDPAQAQLSEWSFDGDVPGITPPMFVIHAASDRVVPVSHSLGLAQAVLRSGGAMDLHVFSEGAHGLGLRGDPRWPISDWPAMAMGWIRSRALF